MYQRIKLHTHIHAHTYEQQEREHEKGFWVDGELQGRTEEKCAQ